MTVCASHIAQKRIACSTCGRLHPIVQDDGCIVYFDCLPSHIDLFDFITALEEAGCDPRPLDHQ